MTIARRRAHRARRFCVSEKGRDVVDTNWTIFSRARTPRRIQSVKSVLMTAASRMLGQARRTRLLHCSLSFPRLCEWAASSASERLLRAKESECIPFRDAFAFVLQGERIAPNRKVPSDQSILKLVQMSWKRLSSSPRSSTNSLVSSSSSGMWKGVMAAKSGSISESAAWLGLM